MFIVRRIKSDDEYTCAVRDIKNHRDIPPTTLTNRDDTAEIKGKKLKLIDTLLAMEDFKTIKASAEYINFERKNIMFKNEESVGQKYKTNDNGHAFYIAGDVNAIGYKPNKSSERIRDRKLTSNFELKGIIGKALFYKTAEIGSFVDFKHDGDKKLKKKYANNEQQEEENVEDGTYKHEYFHDDTEGIIKKYLKYKNKYLEIR